MLTIETRDVVLDELYAVTHDKVEAGEYVLIVVSDNGPGMQEEVLERVLEPFFTTKEIGQGTGLGLSMVYGYAKQSRGHLSIYSEVDAGTAVKLYLPRSKKSSDENAKIKPAEINLAANEVILVVEDDEALRRTVTRMLKRYGYETIAVEDGPSALSVMKATEHIDLMLSDVILPGGMTGPEIIDAARDQHPDMKVLLMSGYTREAMLHRGEITEDIQLIQKPFSSQDLGLALREILEEG